MSSVGEWLESIGLSEYLELFESQRIELDVLSADENETVANADRY